MLEIWGFRVIVESEYNTQNITPKFRACDEGVICESPIYNLIYIFMSEIEIKKDSLLLDHDKDFRL